MAVNELDGELEINLFKTNEYNEKLSFVPKGKNFRLILGITTGTKGKGSLYPIQEVLKGQALKDSRNKNQVSFDLSDEKNKITEIQFVSSRPLQGISLLFSKGKYVIESAVLKSGEGEIVQQWTF